MRKFDSDGEAGRDPAADQRRAFLKRSILGGFAAAVLLPSSASAETYSANDCQVTAADLLGMFSTLAWRLPNQLKAAADAADLEGKIYKDFDTLYRELVELAKQLKLRCDSTAQQDPRLREIFELTQEGQSKVRYAKAASLEERDIAYLQLATLTMAARQVGRSANDISPDNLSTVDPDNKIICQMLGKINEMEVVKTKLDVARKDSQDLFKSFRDSVGRLNKTMLNASESAAKADRGEIGSEAALKDINDAERILDDLTQQSLTVRGGMITPEELRQLIAVPKAMIKKQLPGLQTSRRSRGTVIFENALYEPSSANADSSRIATIIQSYISPSGWWTVTALVGACVGIMKVYQDEGVRRRLINNALQTPFWIDASASNFAAAAAAIAKLRV